MLVTHGKALLTNDPPSRPESISAPPGHPALTAFLGVPLIHGGKTVGMVGLANRPGGYRAADQAALESLAAATVQVLTRQRGEPALQKHREWLRVTLTSIGDARSTSNNSNGPFPGYLRNSPTDSPRSTLWRR